jgi:hypothetical protein
MPQIAALPLPAWPTAPGTPGAASATPGATAGTPGGDSGTPAPPPSAPDAPPPTLDAARETAPARATDRFNRWTSTFFLSLAAVTFVGALIVLPAAEAAGTIVASDAVRVLVDLVGLFLVVNIVTVAALAAGPPASSPIR